VVATSAEICQRRQADGGRGAVRFHLLFPGLCGGHSEKGDEQDERDLAHGLTVIAVC
jgi:hypothetical protein